MRRFAFIEVGPPPDWAYERLLGRRRRDPARAARRCGASTTSVPRSTSTPVATWNAGSATTSSRHGLLYEVFYGFFLPQFEGIDEYQAVELFNEVAPRMDAPEQVETRRVIEELLGEELMV